MSEILEKMEKVPPTLWIIYLVLVPILTNVISNPNIDSQIALWVSILSIIGLLIITIVIIVLNNGEKKRDHELRLKTIEIQQKQTEAQLGYQNQILTPIIQSLADGKLNMEFFDKLMDLQEKMKNLKPQ